MYEDIKNYFGKPNVKFRRDKLFKSQKIWVIDLLTYFYNDYVKSYGCLHTFERSMPKNCNVSIKEFCYHPSKNPFYLIISSSEVPSLPPALLPLPPRDHIPPTSDADKQVLCPSISTWAPPDFIQLILLTTYIL